MPGNTITSRAGLDLTSDTVSIPSVGWPATSMTDVVGKGCSGGKVPPVSLIFRGASGAKEGWSGSPKERAVVVESGGGVSFERKTACSQVPRP